MANVLLHVCDWNYEDKYYELPEDWLREFATKAGKESLESAWDWLMLQVDYGKNPELPVKRCDDKANHTLAEYFLDWIDAEESISEWEWDSK